MDAAGTGLTSDQSTTSLGRVNSVGAYEAKTHLARLLDEVAAGGVVTITRHGRPIARLVPVSPELRTRGDPVAALRVARRGVRRGDVSLRAMIEDGRR